MTDATMARIAFLIPDLRGGGAERVALTLIDGFVARGHEVDLIVMRAQGELFALLPDGVRIIDLKAEWIRHALWPLVRTLRERRPVALQASMWPLTILAVVARTVARSKARLVVSDHGNLSVRFADRPGRLRLIAASLRLFYPRADVRLCVSSALADDLAISSSIDRSRFEVVHNPIPGPPDIVERDPAVEAAWTGAGRRIVSVGTLKREKNHALLLHAFARLDSKSPAHLMIVGEGEMRPRLEQLARELGVANRVSLPGFVLDPWPYYASADLFVLSSDHEGFANVLVEAMATGLPVVSTDCESGPREVLGDGRFGRLVPVGDVEALAAAIEAALDDEPDRAALKQRARAFRPELAVDRYLELMLP